MLVSRPLILSSLLLSSLLSAGVCAQTPSAPPRPGQQAVGETVADRPSPHYRFETHTLDSHDGQRHYRVQIGIPKQPPPPGGYAALYMLDGNAAIDSLTDADLAQLAQTAPPVLVAIGYDVDTRNDVVARAYDYTPPVYENGQLVVNPVVRDRSGGGADVFLRLITREIQPLARQRAPINPARESLWGHSFGGLFTLHVLYTQPQTFANYIVGDPSAWWHDGVLVETWKQFDPRLAAGKRVAFFVGTKPRDANRPPPGGTAGATTGDPRAVVRDMASTLQQAGADASYETFPQYGHGEMIRASLAQALDIVSQP